MKYIYLQYWKVNFLYVYKFNRKHLFVDNKCISVKLLSTVNNRTSPGVKAIPEKIKYLDQRIWRFKMKIW